jgi:hypothetical protein
LLIEEKTMLITKAVPTLSLLLALSCAGGLRPAGARGLAQAAAPEPVALCSAAPPVSAPHAHPAQLGQREDEGCAEPAAPADLQSKLFHQLRYHQSFPATRAQLLAGLRATAELDAAETAWIAARLPALPLHTAKDAMLILFPAAPIAGLALLDTAVPAGHAHTTLAQR